MKKIKAKLKKFWRWYILGDYHCEHCPYCWSDFSSYLGDGDCGCYIFGDLRDTCRLLPPFRALIGWPRMKKTQYWESHQYDNVGEQLEQEFEQDELLGKLIMEILNEHEIQRICPTGEKFPVTAKELVEERACYIRYEYEQKVHPYVYKRLSTEWKELLKKTWESFLDIFRPYFCK